MCGFYIKPKPDGTRPLDEIVEKLPQDHTVMYFMLPTQAAPAQPKQKARPEPKKEWAQWEGGNKSTHKQPNKPWKAKTGGKTYPSGGKLPLALKGCASCLPDGSRLCFAFNIGGCDGAQVGESCDKGYHLCKPEPPDEAQEENVSPKMATTGQAAEPPDPDMHHQPDPNPRDEEPREVVGDPADEEGEPFAIEFCSGTAGLTAQFRKLGMTSSFGVDRIVKGACKAPVVKLDLAREIPLGPGEHGPRPLRSDEHPDGIPVYGAACRLILLCHSLGVHWTVEQPARSIFWLTSFWQSVLAVLTPWIVTFHSCMYGGMRPKKTTLAGDLQCLQELAAECTNQHVHLPWGTTPYGFATAEEVEYPLQLCKRWAQLVYEAIRPSYVQPKAALPAHPDKKARAMANKQTKKSLAFIPEWSHIQSLVVDQVPTFTIGTKLKEAVQVNGVTLPAYSRILRVTQKPIAKTGEEKQLWEIAYGVPWEAESFIQEALLRGHPANIFEGLAGSIKEAIMNNVEKRPEVIARDRAAFLKKWTTRAAELAAQEKVLHDQMPPHRKLILQGKRFLVLREMLREMEFPDKTLVDDMILGFDLVGTAGAEGLLPPDFQPASLTVRDLEMSAEKSNKAIIHSSKSSGSAQVDLELWNKTLEEVSKGWLEPLDEPPKDGGRVSRRFAVVQSDKVRPIDNYSESQVNNGITVVNKCTVDGVDTIAAAICLFMKRLRKRGRRSTLVGRSFDLKSAYRQLAVAESSLKWARLAVYDPNAKQTKCFQQYSLPFGAKSSVVAFLRCARMLQWICLKLDVVLTCYFDDFVCLSGPSLARSAELTFETLLDLLGWRFDRTGEKATELGSSVAALGVVFNLERTSDGLLEVQNTEKRKQDVCAQIAKTLDEGTLTSQAAASLKGRLGFAEGQLFGRAARRLINELGAHATRPPKGNKLSDQTRRALEAVGDQMLTSPPRLADANTDEVHYIFTDASFNTESKEGGIGGVLMDGNGTVRAWFGAPVSKQFCESFMAVDQEQAIGERESFAVLVAFHLWGSGLTRRHLVVFLDNEGCRYLILKGYASNANLQDIVHGIARLELQWSLLPWYARVPTECNLADYPSRQKSHEVLPETLRVPVPSFENVWQPGKAQSP
eukprot:s1613_g19.t1